MMQIDLHNKEKKMAKNDYYTIVAKILVYLYRKYKGLTSDSEKIIPMSDDYLVEEKQLIETIGMMQEQNFIKGINYPRLER